MFKGPKPIFPDPSANFLCDGTVLLIPWEVGQKKDNSRYSVAPFLVVNPKNNMTQYSDDECYFGYFLRQCEFHMQHHSGCGLRQNLAAPWYIVPRNSNGDFTKFTDDDSLQTVFPSDYQHFGVRIKPFLSNFINIKNGISVIPGFVKNVPSFKEVMSISEEDDPNHEKNLVPRFWFPENSEYDDLFNNVPELKEGEFELMMIKFPKQILQLIGKDEMLKQYAQTTKLTLNEMWDNPDDLAGFECGNTLEDNILPQLRAAKKDV